MSKVPVAAWLILAACIVAGLLNEVSASVLNLAMPDAARDVGASKNGAQFILLAGKLTLGALMLAGGAAGDLIGRKRTMLFGIALVGVAAVLSAMARSGGMLGSARILDGIGNALTGPLALALAIASFPNDMRARIVGLFLGISGLGIAIGPLVAGFIVELGGWRAGFLAPLVLAVIGCIAIFVLVSPEVSGPRRPPWDPIGMLSCIVGLVTMVLGFVLAGRDGWLEPVPLALLAVGAATLGLFGWWETSHAPVPLLDPALLRSREVLVALAVALLASMILNGTVLPLLYFLQRIHGTGPVGSVIRLLPLILAAMTTAPLAGGLAEHHGRRLVMLCGLASMAAGGLIMATLSPATAYGVIAIALALIGAGAMAVITPAADLVMATSGEERSGSAAALNGAVMQVGGAIGIGVITNIFLTEGLHAFAARLTERGYTRDQVLEPALRLREMLRETALDRIPPLPDVSGQMQHDILEAYTHGFASGVAQSFLVATLLAVAAMAVLVVGMKGRAPRHGRA